MSKASEYAARVEAAKREPDAFYVTRSTYSGGIDKSECRMVAASVTQQGHLWRGENPIHADEIPAFISWLQDTFGEPTKGGEDGRG
jgi:hypothetical protein